MSRQHFLFLTWFPWGQLSTDLGLSVTLVRKFPDIVISLITEVPYVDKCATELQRLCVDNTERATLLPRIRVFALGYAPRADVDVHDTLEIDMREVTVIPEIVQEQMLAKLPLIMQDERVVDDVGSAWESVGMKPTLILVDYGQARVGIKLKKQFGVPLMLWFPEAGFAYTRWMGPSEKGGKAPGYEDEVLSIYNDEARRAGRSFNQIGRDCWQRSTRTVDDIINIRGLPAYYSYEDSPHDIFVGFVWDLLRGMVALHEEMDGVLLNTVPEVEEEGVLGVLDWETPAGKQVICVGPQLALTHRYDGQKTVSPTTKRKEDEAVAFLDEAHASHGSESVLFISFGSMYFPPPHQLQVLLDAVIATEKPFLMTIPGAHGDFPVELEEKVRKSDRGLLVPWVDQQAILAHAATGWILSHAGAGGTFQALSQGVPMICWPFATDQPQFSLWVTDMLDAGFYLIQNRTGPAASLKASRGGPAGMRIIGTDEAIRMELDNVLRQSQGMVGVRKRANAQKTGKAIWEFIRPEGGAWRELDKLRVYFA